MTFDPTSSSLADAHAAATRQQQSHMFNNTPTLIMERTSRLFESLPPEAMDRIHGASSASAMTALLTDHAPLVRESMAGITAPFGSIKEVDYAINSQQSTPRQT